MAAPCTKSELRIYDRTGTGSYTAMPANGVSFSKSLGGGGFLSATFDARQSALVSSPTMLDDCVIKLCLPLTDGSSTMTAVAAYANRAKNGVIHSGAGLSTREVRSAPTLWTAWAQDAILHTEANAIPQMAGEQRYFGVQSTIYDYTATDSAQWDAPSASTGKQNATTGARAGNPDGWPSALGDAYWITRGSTNNGSRHIFIADVTVSTAAYCTLYFSSDESAAVYFAGELVIQTSSSETGYETVEFWPAWVEAGTYRVCIDKTSIVSRGGDGVDPVLLGFATVTDAGAVDTVLLVTNSTDWKVHTMDPVTGEAPSLTPGQIMGQLHSEASARSVDTWAAITPSFSDTADTSSTAWGKREERCWRIGYDTHLDMIEGLGDLGVDVDITPALGFDAYYNRGADVSGSVVIEALVTADQIDESGVGVAATVLYVETQDGWTPSPLTNASALSTYGRREQALSLGNAPSVAQGVRLGQQVLDERLSRSTSEWSVDFYAATGCVPFVDFNLGDTVGIKVGATTYDRVVLELGGAQAHTEGIVRWTIKTGEVL